NKRSSAELGTPRLWADQICIDQLNVAEHNHQVTLTGKTCSSASVGRIAYRRILDTRFRECGSNHNARLYILCSTCSRTSTGGDYGLCKS
ncbi:hypothetical protein EJ08DRAFT_600629, partial [Tothia fuscella]